MLAAILSGLIGLAGIGSLVCMILVIVQMFRHEQTGLGVVTIVLSFCGFGPLIAFIYGWVKAGEWRIKRLMTVWSVLIVVMIGLYGIAIAVIGPQLMQQIEQQQRQQMERLQKEQGGGREQGVPTTPEATPTETAPEKDTGDEAPKPETKSAPDTEPDSAK